MITFPYKKIFDIKKGKLMVVSDLQGNLKDYLKIKEVFLKLKEVKRVDYLIFDGDLIHSDLGEEDGSKEIIDDLIKLKANSKKSPYIAILGNHELAHIYEFSLSKGKYEYTSSFEKVIYPNREKYVNFFKEMPFGIRTDNQILINHTGANSLIGEKLEKRYNIDFNKYSNFNHESQIKSMIKELELEKLKNNSNKINYKLGNKLMESKIGYFLFEIFMNKNEKEYAEEYFIMLNNFLSFMSEDLSFQLRFLVSGHVRVPNGMEIIGEKQLRLSTSCGAKSDSEKTFLLLNSEKNYNSIYELSRDCFKLY
jgi:hypothetical protein